MPMLLVNLGDGCQPRGPPVHLVMKLLNGSETSSRVISFLPLCMESRLRVRESPSTTAPRVLGPSWVQPPKQSQTKDLTAKYV